jgi:hypothetical protein
VISLSYTPKTSHPTIWGYIVEIPIVYASKIGHEKSTSKSGYFWKKSQTGQIKIHLGYDDAICNRPTLRIIPLPDMLSYF